MTWQTDTFLWWDAADRKVDVEWPDGTVTTGYLDPEEGEICPEDGSALDAEPVWFVSSKPLGGDGRLLSECVRWKFSD